ncbi:MAG: hypothetical protein ACYCX2_03725 [Christensenellales bacterium]
MGNANMNPTSTYILISGGKFTFKCPICQSTIIVSIQNVDAIIGINVICLSCKNVIHVPGGYKTWPKPSGLKITGGVQVPISNYVDWFFSHPLVVSLKKSNKMDLLYDYGLWGFCPSCYYQYSATVLSYTFPVFHMSKPSEGFVLLTSRPDSENVVSSLKSGHCPKCSNTNLIVIVAEIPSYVQNIFFKKTRQHTDIRL